MTNQTIQELRDELSERDRKLRARLNQLVTANVATLAFAVTSLIAFTAPNSNVKIGIGIGIAGATLLSSVISCVLLVQLATDIEQRKLCQKQLDQKAYSRISYLKSELGKLL